MEGIFSNQLTKNNALYGYTRANFYFDLYIPWIGQGSNIRVLRLLGFPHRDLTAGAVHAVVGLSSFLDQGCGRRSRPGPPM
jgi:hypothetical protein